MKTAIDIKLKYVVGLQRLTAMGSGGGQVVSVFAFYSDNPGSNTLKPTVFSVNFVFEKNENTQKRPGDSHGVQMCMSKPK